MSKSNEFNVSIKDFQIIKNASLTFLPGLNCIIGQSNNGKSAILRATKAAIYNVAGTTSVRLGCNSYAVGIQANGHTIIFQKGANSAYKIDGVTMGKIGRTQIPEVAEALQIKELNLNGSNEEINFLDQMEKPFLLDRSETDLFRFIVDSGKDSNVTLALKTITQDRQQLTRDITTTEGRLEQVEHQLKSQEDVLSNSEAKLALFQSVIDLGPRISRVKEITSLKGIILSQREEYLKFDSFLKLRNSILDSITGSVDKISNATKKQELLSLIIKNISKASEEKGQLEERQSKLDKVDGTRLQDFVSRWNSISFISREHFRIDSELDVLKKKVYPEINQDFTNSVSSYNNISALVNEIKSCEEQLKSFNAQYEIIVNDLANAQKEINDLGVCPMCGKPLHV